MKSVMQRAAKDARLNIRARAHQKDVIARAAALQGTTISDFVLEKAYEAAHRALAEETTIRLPRKQWAAFVKALDAPPKAPPRLKRLLVESSILEP